MPPATNLKRQLLQIPLQAAKEIEIIESTKRSTLEIFLGSWLQDLGEEEQAPMGELAELADHVSRLDSLGAESDAWRCADVLVRRHIPTLLHAASLSIQADQFLTLAPISVRNGSADATTALNGLSSTLSQLQAASRDDSQKRSWSRAWPSAWNKESSSRWAHARDAAAAAAYNASWRTTRMVVNRSGLWALRSAAINREPESLPATLAAQAVGTANSILSSVIWSATWPRI